LPGKKAVTSSSPISSFNRDREGRGFSLFVPRGLFSGGGELLVGHLHFYTSTLFAWQECEGRRKVQLHIYTATPATPFGIIRLWSSASTGHEKNLVLI